MKIQNDSGGVLVSAGINLQKGLNENIDPEAWERIKDIPYVAERLADGRYTVLEENEDDDGNRTGDDVPKVAEKKWRKKKFASKKHEPSGGDKEANEPASTAEESQDSE